MADPILERIKNEIDIVDVVSEYIDLTKKGRNFWALCPFHEDSNPSMSVSPDKQLFKCFVCGAGGDVVRFVSDYEKISFPFAKAKLAQKIGVEIKVHETNTPRYTDKQKEMIEVMNDAMEYFQYSLMTEEGTIALEYAEKRDLNSRIREEFKIGFAPNSGLQPFLERKGYDKSLLINAGLTNQAGGDFFRGRLVFGIANQYGDVVAFSARDLTGKSNAKYINSPESKLFSKSNTLYNFANAKEPIRRAKEVFINEGFMDVIAMSKAGFNNSVAIMGTALTKEHVSYLIGKKIVLMLDSDKAGVNATIKSIKTLLDAKIKTYVVSNDEAKDPDELFNSVGVEGLREVAEKQIDALEYIFNLHTKQFPDKSPSAAHAFVASLAKYLKNADDMTKDFYITKMSETLGISRGIILKEIPMEKAPIVAKAPLQPVIAPSKPIHKPFVPKPKPVEKKAEIIEAPKNAHRLILSMIKKPFLIEQYKKRPVILEPALAAIANYLVKMDAGDMTPPSNTIKRKVQQISLEGQYVHTTDAFVELIGRVNKEAKTKTIEAFELQLINTSDFDERVKLITKIQKLKAGK